MRSMNRKFLVWTSLLIALLLHVAFFSLTTFVFPIDSADFKPKFFFLGPILSKNDVKWSSSHDGNPTSNSMPKNKNVLSAGNTLKSMGSEMADQAKSPFAIQAIKKPLMPRTDDSQRKIFIKSTFETSLKAGVNEEANMQERLSPELKIPPYKPLRFRTP